MKVNVKIFPFLLFFSMTLISLLSFGSEEEAPSPFSLVKCGAGEEEDSGEPEPNLFTLMQSDPRAIFGDMDEEEASEWQSVLARAMEFLNPDSSDVDVYDLLRVIEEIGFERWEGVLETARALVLPHMKGSDVANILGTLNRMGEEERARLSGIVSPFVKDGDTGAKVGTLLEVVKDATDEEAHVFLGVFDKVPLPHKWRCLDILKLFHLIKPEDRASVVEALNIAAEVFQSCRDEITMRGIGYYLGQFIKEVPTYPVELRVPYMQAAAEVWMEGGPCGLLSVVAMLSTIGLDKWHFGIGRCDVVIGKGSKVLDKSHLIYSLSAASEEEWDHMRPLLIKAYKLEPDGMWGVYLDAHHEGVLDIHDNFNHLFKQHEEAE